MIDLSPLKLKKPVAILGLAKSGLAADAALRAAGIETVLWDDGEKAREGRVTEDFSNADFSRFSLLCMAPGIPLTHPKPHPAVLKAKEAGVEIVCDIELLHRAHPENKTIGITGTNGKSTTTALIGHILKVANVESAVGGNIGEASLTLPQLSKEGTYVLELSSFQLDLCPTFAPDIAVHINISPDHLDRHGDMKGYVTAKERIFRGPGVAIIGIDDAESRGMRARIKDRRVMTVSVEDKNANVYVDVNGILFHDGKRIDDLKTCKSLQGRHNWQNAGMAYAACLSRGVSVENIVAAMHSFPGLVHRQNIVAEKDGVTYINDSKATNDQAAAQALRTYNPIYWIAGGKAKDGGYADCAQYIGHVRHAFLIGDGQKKIAAFLDEVSVPYTLSGTLDMAVSAAHRMAQAEHLRDAVVLLSPACASFDQFRSFEHRGEVFVELVKKVTA